MSIRHSERVTGPQRLVGYVEESRSGATYTVAPDDAVGYDLMSQWITAPASFVECLESMR